eukprot:3458710-Prymnesium_polylepis.1
MACAWSLSRFPERYDVHIIEPGKVVGGVACSLDHTFEDGTQATISKPTTAYSHGRKPPLDALAGPGSQPRLILGVPHLQITACRAATTRRTRTRSS